MDHSRIYGLNACLQFAKHRQEKIVRAFFSKKIAPQFSALMKSLASQKKVYRIIENDELEKVSQSQHHEGVCFIVEKNPKDFFKNKTQEPLVVLENIGNPHNLGAIMRICAHFGIQTIAMNDGKIAQSGAALRIAEGGAEFIQIVEYKNLRDFVSELKKAEYQILTTSSHEGKILYQYKFPPKFVLLFGEEGRGLSQEAMGLGQACLQIPGTQNVESLNVSTAISVILGEVYRQKNFKG